MSRVVVTFWAGARSAAGLATEEVSASTPAEVLAELRSRHPDARFQAVLTACSVLVDGVVVRTDGLDRPFGCEVEPGERHRAEQVVRFEVLPPFAGGARLE